MAGQADLRKHITRTKVLSSNVTALVGWNYHITTASTITLPVTGLAVGDFIKFTKKLTISPTITTTSGVLIKVVKGSTPQTDTSVTFDIEADITFVWNGSEWEV